MFHRLFWDCLVGSPAFPMTVRVALMRCRKGIKIGNNVSIGSRCIFSDDLKLTIGDNVFINDGCRFYGNVLVSIGAGCAIGYETMLCAMTHEIGNSANRARGLVAKPIVLETGVWTGARVTILPGVTISKGCIIAAGAIVVRSCEVNGLYGGVPARKLKELAI